MVEYPVQSAREIKEQAWKTLCEAMALAQETHRKAAALAWETYWKALDLARKVEEKEERDGTVLQVNR